MKQYVGIKHISAMPMDSHAFLTYMNVGTTADFMKPVQEGYLVEYQNGGKSNHPNHAGYISWSPKDVFESSYFNTEAFECEFEEMSLRDMASEITRFKKAKEIFKNAGSLMTKIYDHLTINVVPEKMDEEGMDTIKIAGIGRLQTSSDIRCNVLAANREALKSWLIEKGHSDLVTDTVNASTLKAFIKEQTKKDGDLPTDLVSIEPYSRATVVKA